MARSLFFFIRNHRTYRELSLLSFITFLFGIIYGLFSLYLPIFVEEVVANVALVGILLALPEVSGVLFDLPLGAFVDRWGRRKTTILGALLLVVVALLFQSWQSVVGLAVLLFFYGIILELVIIPTGAELMAISPRRRSGKFFGVYEAMHNFGYAVGPFAGGFLLSLTPSPIFLVLAGISLLFFLVVFFVMERRRKETESMIHAAAAVVEKDHFFEGSVREFRALGAVGWLLLLFWFTFSFRWGAIAVIEPLFAVKLHISPVMIGLIYAASSLPFFFFSIWAGKVTDRHGGKLMVVGGLFLMGSATFLFGMFEDATVLFALAFVAALGDALLVPSTLALFDTLSSNHFKGRISGVVTLVESFGYLLGPLIAGPLVALVGFPFTFYSFGIFILLVMAVAMVTKFR